MANKKKTDDDYDSFWSFINGEDDTRKSENEQAKKKQKETSIEDEMIQEDKKTTVVEELEGIQPKAPVTNSNGKERNPVDVFNDLSLFDTDEDSDGSFKIDPTFEDEEEEDEKESDDWISKPVADKIKTETKVDQEEKQVEKLSVKDDAVGKGNNSTSSPLVAVMKGIVQLCDYIMGSKLALVTYAMAIMAAVIAARRTPIAA